MWKLESSLFGYKKGLEVQTLSEADCIMSTIANHSDDEELYFLLTRIERREEDDDF